MVINEDMKKTEITKSDMLPLSFLELRPYTGSKRGLRFRLEKVSAEDEANKKEGSKFILRVYAWKGKMAFANTAPEEISHKDLEFCDQGIDEAVKYLNELADEGER